MNGIIHTGYFKLFHNRVTTTGVPSIVDFVSEWRSWYLPHTFTNKHKQSFRKEDEEQLVTGGVDDKDDSYDDGRWLSYFKLNQCYQIINVRRNRRWHPPSETEVQALLLLVGSMLLLLPQTKNHSTVRDITISMYLFWQVSCHIQYTYNFCHKINIFSLQLKPNNY